MNKLTAYLFAGFFIAGLLIVIFREGIQENLGEDTAFYVEIAAQVLFTVVHFYSVYLVFIRKRFTR